MDKQNNSILIPVIIFIIWLISFCIEKYVKTIKTKSFKDINGNKVIINDFVYVKFKNDTKWRVVFGGPPVKYKVIDIDNYPYNSKKQIKIIVLGILSNEKFELYSNSFDFLKK